MMALAFSSIRSTSLLMVVAVMLLGQIGSAGQPVDPLHGLAERYVRLVLAVGQHDADYVDAYYGPPAWRTEAEAVRLSLADIGRQAAALETELAAAPADPPLPDDAELWALRLQYLARQIGALRTRVSMLQGTRLSFDEESRALYDAVSPPIEEAELRAVIDRLEARLPGEGPLIDRFERFKAGFVVPPARLGRVFQAAIRACRNRTIANIDLPPGENFTVEYVTGKSWSGYNWYQGNFRSLIQVNTDLPIYIDRAIDLACHEGYPGHHVYNVLLEQHLVRDRGWVEFSVYPLFSPQSLIAEGTANFGIEVAFSKDERRDFERDMLFPLAGLDPARVDEYYDVLALVDDLAYAGNEAARQYLDGTMTAAEATAWLQEYAMMSAQRAEQRIKFFDQYRSYVINYNVGKDLVRRHIESRGGSDDDPRERWRQFAALLSSPRLPSGLH